MAKKPAKTARKSPALARLFGVKWASGWNKKPKLGWAHTTRRNLLN